MFQDPNSNPNAGLGDWLKRLGPGLFDVGTGIYNRNAAVNEGDQRLQTAQGPVYGAAQNQALNALTQAGSMNPNDMAANRFAANRALVAPVQSKNLDDLMRRMFAQGNLGVSTYNPGVPGITPNGTPMNPQLAAFFAAQNADNSTTAYNSMNEGQTYLQNLLKNSGMLTNQANNQQFGGVYGQSQRTSPAAVNKNILSGVGGILKSNPGLFGKGVDWLGQQTGWWGDTPDIKPLNDLNSMDWAGDFS